MNDKERIRVLQEALKVAAELVANNPPGDLDTYTPDQLSALIGCIGNPKPWLRYFISEGVKRTVMIKEEKLNGSESD